MADMKSNKEDDMRKNSEDNNREAYYSLGTPGKFLRGDYALEQLGITEKTLYTLAESGEFSLGRIGGSKVIIADSFYEYLDRVHFKEKENESDPPAIDAKGIIKYDLTLVGEKHKEVPKLYGIRKFAKDLGIEERTFIRHCDLGTFYHYRIGTLYKMSQEDYDKSLEQAALKSMKSNRGRKSGRTNKVSEQLANQAKNKQHE